MSRAKGTYATLENWALDLAPSLPGAAGWVLLALCRQSNYNRKTLKVAELMVATHAGERTVQKALSYLVSEKLVQLTPEGYLLSRPSKQIDASLVSKRSQGLRKNLHPQNPENIVLAQENSQANSEIKIHKKKEEEGNKEKEQQKRTAPVGADRTVSFPDSLNTLSGFGEAWSDWLAYRRKRRLTVLPETLTAQLGMLTVQPDPVAVIRQSIAQGWQGLFPLKNQTRSSHRPAPHQLDQQDWDAVAADSERERQEYLRLASGGWN